MEQKRRRRLIFTVGYSLAYMIPIITHRGESIHAIACTVDDTIMAMTTISVMATSVVVGDGADRGKDMIAAVGIVRHAMAMAEAIITEDIALLGKKCTRQSVGRKKDGAD